MAVFEIQHIDFTFGKVDAECEAAIGSDAQASSTRYLCDLRSACGLSTMEARGVLRGLPSRPEMRTFSELVREVRRHALGAVFPVEHFQAFVNEAPDFHLIDCSLWLNTCQLIEIKSNQDAGFVKPTLAANGAQG
jgi:hypothetical protein